MAIFHGNEGSLTFGGTAFGDAGLAYAKHCFSWTLNYTREFKDATEYTDSPTEDTAWHTWLPELGSWGVTFNCYVDDTDTRIGLLTNNMVTQANIRLFHDATHYWAGVVYCHNVSDDTDANGVPVLRIECIGTGSLTPNGW